MGDGFQVYVDLDATPVEAPRLAARAVEWLVAEGVVLAEPTDCVPGRPLGHPPGPDWERAVTEDWDGEPYDGLAVHTSRTAFSSGEDNPEAAICPRCAVPSELDETTWPRFNTAIGTWNTTGDARVDCPACATAVPLPEWRWDGPGYAFGYLGLEFWGWPEFTEEFRERLSQVLDGHRITYLWGSW